MTNPSLLSFLLAVVLLQGITVQADESNTNSTAPSTVTANVTTSGLENVTLASDVHLNISVDVPDGFKLQPSPLPKKWGDWTIASSEMQQTSPQKHEIKLTLRPNQVGKQTIPAWPIYYQDKSGKPGYVEVKAIDVEVVTKIAKGDENLNGMGSENKLVQVKKRIYPYVILGTFAVILLVLLWSMTLRHKKSGQKVVPKSPYELAMERMKALLESGLVHRDVKLFYVELTGIVREFIERTTLINAPELTTEEFLYKISQGNVFSDVEKIKLKQFLESADMVKFAQYDPGEAGINTAIHSAEAFICIEMQQHHAEEEETFDARALD